jgi:cellulose synthase/poly-beta-1,6-N-acetylglucosamine synthase-like glycosyltransferase
LNGLFGLLAIPLTLFMLRRWLFLTVALPKLPANKNLSSAPLPDLLLLVPAHNEADRISELLAQLEQLDYPDLQLHIMVIDDGSDDDTGVQLKRWAASRSAVSCLQLPTQIGKSAALAVALQRSVFGEHIVVMDADDRPDPEGLRRLVAAFSDLDIGAVSGARWIANPAQSWTSSYAHIENRVHQRITMVAKDRLGLAPALLGSNCAYRRTALISAGGFEPGFFLEDSDLTLRLTQAGWRTRYLPAARSEHAAATAPKAYWRQHRRWSAGFGQVSRARLPMIWRDRRLPLLLRLELTLFAVGYLDRLFMLMGLIAILAGWAPGWFFIVWLLALLSPFVQVLAALALSGTVLSFWPRILVLPLFYGIDLAAALAGLLPGFGSTTGIWRDESA